jgi:exodeoxyribonuclease VII large subunit
VSETAPILTVSEITGRIRRTLETEFGRVRVRGEISNFRKPASGHLYFALKDSAAQLRAVMFRGAAIGLRFLPADGVEVEAEGELSLYEPRGDLQLIVRRMVPSGIGALMQAFEALKRRLAGEGLFEADRKRPLPAYPWVIGLITSPTGAAVRDLLHVLGRRWPAAEIVFIPVRVQGEEAAAEIAAAVERMDRWGGADVMIVGRGGGSLEDLWAFNEEPVARAIAACRTPVVSAVGHEIDVTIADLVADVRAATPSAAAEIVTPDRREVSRGLLNLWERAERRVSHAVETRRAHLTRLAGAYGFRRPERFLRREAQRVDELAARLGKSTERALAGSRRSAVEASRRLAASDPAPRVRALWLAVGSDGERLERAARVALRARRGTLVGVERALAALDPTAVLGRGYCLVRDPSSGRIRMAAAGLAEGAPVVLQFSNDRAHARVVRVEGGGPRELDALREGTS